MKKLANSKSNLLHGVKNFWFALQWLIVSISLPVMSFFQVSHAANVASSKQTEKVTNAGSPDNMPGEHVAVKTAKLNC